MRTKSQVKLTATLFATTVMATMIVLPEAAFGAGHVARYHEAQTAKANAQRNALADPTRAFAGPAAPGNMNQALADAAGDATSAAYAMPLGTDAEKAAALHAVVHSANPTDAPHKLAIRKALGLTADPADTAKLDAFEQAAQEKLVHPVVHAGVVVAHQGAQRFLNALLHMHAELTAAPAAGNLTGVISDATLGAGAVPLVGGAGLAANGAAHGMPHATPREKIAVLRAIIAARGSADFQALAALLGTDDNAQLNRYCEIASFEEVDVPAAAAELNGIAGGDILAKLVEVRRRVNTATRKAKAPYGGFAGGPAADINNALTRAGL